MSRKHGPDPVRSGTWSENNGPQPTRTSARVSAAVAIARGTSVTVTDVAIDQRRISTSEALIEPSLASVSERRIRRAGRRAGATSEARKDDACDEQADDDREGNERAEPWSVS